MRIRRHIGVVIVSDQQFGGLARSGLRRGERHLIFGHAIANRRAPGGHHRSGDLTGMAGQLQLVRRLDYAHLGQQGRHRFDPPLIDLRPDKSPHQRWHVIRLNLNSRRAAQCIRQFSAPF
jgi:hypothetical protein